MVKNPESHTGCQHVKTKTKKFNNIRNQMILPKTIRTASPSRIRKQIAKPERQEKRGSDTEITLKKKKCNNCTKHTKKKQKKVTTRQTKTSCPKQYVRQALAAKRSNLRSQKGKQNAEVMSRKTCKKQEVQK